MMRVCLALFVFSQASGLAWAEDYQKLADNIEWKFDLARASVLDSFQRYDGPGQIELTRKPDKIGVYWVSVADNNGMKVLTFMGNSATVFAQSGNVIVFADFHPSSNGCKLKAFDLTNGKGLWHKDLRGLGPIPHTRYSNKVNLDIVNQNAVRVFGNESAGQYVEYVDLKTGETLGHRRVK